MASIGAKSIMSLTPEMEKARKEAHAAKVKAREEERIMKQLENSKMKKKLTTTGAKSVMALSPETEAARAQAAQDAKLARKTSIRRLSTASMLFQKKLDTVSKKIDDSLKLGDE